MSEHNAGRVISTKAHRPLELAWSIEVASEGEARALELRIKKQRLLKESIIRRIEEKEDNNCQIV